MDWKQTTSIDDLRSEGCIETDAVLKYGERALATRLTENGFLAAVYEFVESEEETGLSYVELRLNLRTKSTMIFDDNGEAIKWCFDHLDD